MIRSRLVAAGTVAAAVTLLAAAGCGGDDTKAADRTLTRPADLPTAAQLAKDDSVVRAGTWGVVRAPDTETSTDIIAIKVTSMDRGEAGAFKDVRVMNAAGGRDMATAVPFYIAYDFAVISGNRFSTPSQLLYASTATGADNLDSLSVPQGVDKCRTPRDINNYPPDVGYALHGCLTVAGHAGAVPTLMVFDAVSAKGSRQVKFQITAGGT